MRTKCGTILAATVALAAVADGGAPRLFTMDMVHHNPGDKPTESRFLDPAYLAEMGSGAKVVNDFRYPQCACTFEEFDAEIFPAGSPERKWVDDFAAEVEAKARDCHEKGLECHYFMDIIVLPRRLIEKYRSEICGEDGRVSFEREKTWEIHRLMIREMLRRIPSVDGYVIRTGEMYSHNVPYHGGNTPLDFRKPLDGFVDTHAKLMNLLREEICVNGGKKVFYRTWDFRRFHIRPDLYLAITDQVEPHEKLFLSIKHTAGDYLRYVPFNPTLGIGKHKQIVEVQCQREYEGKGAYPNYVVKGVVEGFEENAACPGIQGLGDFLKDSRFAGVWTWSRGGGWEGPYLKNELWCAMNAFVMTEWANHPEAGEEVAFGKFMDRIGVAAESREAFRRLAVLSAEAVVRGMGYMPDEKLTACWTRDHFIGGFGDPELDADANRLVKESKVAASLANRRAAVERWREIVRLADSVKIADKAAESYVRVSSRYGLHLYRIYEAGWTAMLLMRQREVSCKTDEKEIAAAVKRYDEAWRDYRALAADPQCATLFDGHFAEYHISQDHNSIDPAPGMDAEVDKARRFLNGELLRCDGLVTEKTPGWRFEASGAKGGAAFNPLEGWYPDKGGKLVSPRIAIPKAGAYYKLSFTGSAPVRSYETVAFYDAAGNMIADNYDVIYGERGTGNGEWGTGNGESSFAKAMEDKRGMESRYERVVFAQEGVKAAEVFFQSSKGCTVSDVKFEPATVDEAAKWCDGVYKRLPAVKLTGGDGTPPLPPKTLDALKTGKPWRILMLGDSIMQDTFHSQFHALVKRAYPKSDVTWLVSVRGSTGCWYYCEPENFRKYVADYKPDCVFIGGISGWIHPEMPLNGGPAIESVARRVNAELGAEVVVMTPTLAIDLRVPKGTEQGTSVAPAKFDHAAIGDKAWKYDVAAAEELKAICAKNGWPLWDMFTPAYDWLFKTGLPSEFYSRDYVHSGELGKQIIGRIALGYFASAARLLPDCEAERIAREKLAVMTLEEKVSLCGLCATMYLNAIPRVGIDREWAFSDGSHGLKPEHNRDRWGYIGGVDDRSTSMPCMSALASTWNRALAAKHGDVMGSQMRSRSKDQMLGPGLNVMRNPICGRNWEYMSEDPLVISQMAVPLIQAAQSHGLACTPKHYCLNSQELSRFDTCSTVDSRALHEIYLPAFEAAVKGGALSLMTAYNRYNGTYCSESSYLQRALLREQWGFRGTIVTDWGGQHSCDNAVLNGGGMEANCGNKVTHLTDFYGTNGGDKYPLATSVKEGRVPESVVDEMAMRTLYVMAKTGFLSGSQDKGERLVERHREVARAIGEEAIILAKNAKGVLPLEKAKTRKLVVFGQVARLKQAEFGSSCECHVVSEISFLDGLREYLGGSCEIAYYPLGGEVGESEKAADEGETGYDIGGIVALTAAGKEPRVPLAQLRGECAAADAVLVFTGTTMGFGQAQETEGEDRPNMKSAPGHDEEIAEILSWELPRTVVVCRAGSALELPWLGDCDTMLLASYLGQEAGRPMAKVLFGDVNPSGKLTFTWPKRYADTPTGFFGERAYNATNSVYLEGVYVGYRWYEKRGIPVDFPFGHGLSYTDFRLRTSDIRNCGGDFIVKVDVANVGGRDGAEVVQLYVAAKEPKVDRPVKELKGFEKVFLGKGETKTVEFRITPRDLAYWDAFASCFRADAGTYALQVGTSSSDIRDSADIVLEEGREFK